MTKFFEERGVHVPELYEQENNENPIAHAHFLKESASGKVWHWYVTEASDRDGDVLMFGLVDGHDRELGYFSLMQLAGIGAGFDEDFEPVGVFDIYEDFDLRS